MRKHIGPGVSVDLQVAEWGIFVSVWQSSPSFSAWLSRHAKCERKRERERVPLPAPVALSPPEHTALSGSAHAAFQPSTAGLGLCSRCRPAIQPSTAGLVLSESLELQLTEASERNLFNFCSSHVASPTFKDTRSCCGRKKSSWQKRCVHRWIPRPARQRSEP